ncbi:hypothetical protein NQ318_020439 [Aromia moschata]|uniref:Transmembrane protein n=1 Tax=Aromia moschata TaxID=1265417 RepID=A0AAV8YK59_9CUCU|nr:hypothetical protein NQ318_020439 [Aromia moschata]
MADKAEEEDVEMNRFDQRTYKITIVFPLEFSFDFFLILFNHLLNSINFYAYLVNLLFHAVNPPRKFIQPGVYYLLGIVSVLLSSPFVLLSSLFLSPFCLLMVLLSSSLCLLTVLLSSSLQEF